MATTTSIECGERLSIDTVEKLYAAMERALLESSDVELRAADIQYCDTAGLQLVLSLRQTLATTDNDIHWHDANDVLLSTAKHLGLVAALNLSSVQ